LQRKERENTAMSYILRIICYNRIASIAGFLEFLGFFIEKPINYIEISKKGANFIDITSYFRITIVLS